MKRKAWMNDEGNFFPWFFPLIFLASAKTSFPRGSDPISAQKPLEQVERGSVESLNSMKRKLAFTTFAIVGKNNIKKKKDLRQGVGSWRKKERKKPKKETKEIISLLLSSLGCCCIEGKFILLCIGHVQALALLFVQGTSIKNGRKTTHLATS
jgi:hypothetical protein